MKKPTHATVTKLPTEPGPTYSEAIDALDAIRNASAALSVTTYALEALDEGECLHDAVSVLLQARYAIEGATKVLEGAVRAPKSAVTS